MSSPVNMHHNSRPSQPSARRLLRQQPFGLLRARNHIPGSPRIPSLCQERYEEEDVSVQRSLMRYQGTVAARKGCEIWTWGTTCLLFFNSSSRRKLDWYLKWLPDCYEVRMLALIISLAVCGFLLWTIRYWFRKMMDPKKHLKAEKARKQLEDISKKQVEDSQAYEQAWNQAAKLTEQAAEKLLSMTQRQVSPTSLDLPHGSAVPGLEQQHAVVVELLEKVRTKLRTCDYASFVYVGGCGIVSHTTCMLFVLCVCVCGRVLALSPCMKSFHPACGHEFTLFDMDFGDGGRDGGFSVRFWV
eukprot:GHVQ01008368.1.p1 GENE.GHVQ01008368.1~~GHVQ01008368.1.p1  ORF type:complete len:300 (-),score=44.79 GHVQ01008368.1:453-1352(-)